MNLTAIKNQAYKAYENAKEFYAAHRPAILASVTVTTITLASLYFREDISAWGKSLFGRVQDDTENPPSFVKTSIASVAAALGFKTKTEEVPYLSEQNFVLIDTTYFDLIEQQAELEEDLSRKDDILVVELNASNNDSTTPVIEIVESNASNNASTTPLIEITAAQVIQPPIV